MGGTTGVAAKARAAPVASPATCPGPRRSSRFDVAIDLQNAFQDENSRVDKEGVLRAIAGSLLEPSAIGASGAGGQRALVAKSDGLFHILQDHVNSKFLGDQNAFFSALVNIADKVNRWAR